MEGLARFKGERPGRESSTRAGRLAAIAGATGGAVDDLVVDAALGCEVVADTPPEEPEVFFLLFLLGVERSLAALASSFLMTSAYASSTTSAPYSSANESNMRRWLGEPERDAVVFRLSSRMTVTSLTTMRSRLS